MLIKPIKLISKDGYESIVGSDLKILFSKVNFGQASYKFYDFEYVSPENKDLKIIEEGKSMVAMAYWKKKEGINKIYFSDDYFKLSDEERLSYFFHEICHYHTYSNI